ncbi:MAG: HAMP domain-containing histidine kinase [Thaumarchaeota archaeon]|nr:HAMP domain-containing histidine kinase [Nitrososphaerota archaeon]
MVAILISAAVINLFLFYQDTNSQTTQSYSIIRVGDVKVTAESISALATSVASGNKDDKEQLDKQILEVENIVDIIKNGGTIKGQSLEKIPSSLSLDYDKVAASWESYKSKAQYAENTSVFDPEAIKAVNYILEKNNELVLLSNNMVNEFENLGRDYNRHKQIATDLTENVNVIGQQTLLISIGEEEDTQNKLKENRLEFDIGIRKLLQISTVGLDVESVGKEHEELIPLPRENSNALRQLDPLWESMQVRISILEERALLSPEFNVAKKEMNAQKELLYNDIDKLLQNWSLIITAQGSEEESIIQIILVVDIAVFFMVLIIIRKSLSPLATITQALSRVKEGAYGEKIEYSGNDEVGQLVQTFNMMSNTIKEKEEEAKKIDIAKDEFLAMITHELKTPLVPIQGYSDILLSEHLGKLNDKQKERIQIIKSSSESLLSLISDLLDAQKLELGQLSMNKENTNIKETIDKVIESLKPEATQKNIEINSSVVDLTINHDQKRIGQVMTNLIKNSLAATESNTGKIEIMMENRPTEIKISIKDNGRGIHLDKQKELFKKFYQVDATLTRERGGSGLGLAICKGIIQGHNGEISMQSIPNQGSTFSFTIPKASE